VIGATELGDGRPVLIVDAEALVRLGRQSEGTVSA
jgi:chemotaxis protein histidine kinase CheA